MIQQWGPETLAQILKLNSIGEFLYWLCDQERSRTRVKPKLYSYAELARLFNYKSRSYIREVAEKKSKPNPQLIGRLSQYFKFNNTWKKYFELLCLLEAADEKDRYNLKTELLLQKQKLQKQISILRTSFEKNKTDIYIHSPLIPVIYSALGSLEKGASLDEIILRTHINEIHIRPALDTLVQSSSVIFQDGRYYAKSNQVMIDRCHDQETFINDVNWTLKNLQTRINSKSIHSDEMLFLSTYSIADDQLAQFKKKLSALLTEFSTDTESPDGNKVVKLSAFLTY